MNQTMNDDDKSRDRYDALDRDALQRALDQYILLPEGERRVKTKLRKGATWEECARAAVFHFQPKVFQLRSWETPPCEDHFNDEDERGYKLRLRMIELDISQFETDSERLRSLAEQ